MDQAARHIVCPHCDSVNRIPADKPAGKAKCGVCHQALFTGRPVLRTPHRGFEYPAWAYNAMGGRPEIVDPGIFLAGKTIAGTVLDLLTVEGELEKARAEFNERTGGGVGGERWMAPLLPRDFQPPIDLRWPEYVTTERGEEWWIPTPVPGASERIA